MLLKKIYIILVKTDRKKPYTQHLSGSEDSLTSAYLSLFLEPDLCEAFL